MTRLWDRMLGREPVQENEADRAAFSTLTQLYATPDAERILPQFEYFAAEAFGANSIIFSLIARRIALFSEAVFKYRSLSDKHLFGDPSLETLENPWPNASTGEMLARMEQDVSLAGNAYIRNAGSRLERLRPDWVTIVSEVTTDAEDNQVREVLGYWFQPMGDSARRPAFYLVEEVAHWSPMPDPLANFRGMSWITPVMRDIDADVAMTKHREAFFRNAAPQPLDAKVLTPSGWTTMGAVRLGNRVVGQDGKAHEVIGVFPRGEQDIYRVTFSDGASTECTLDHVWRVASIYDRKHGTYRTMSLADIVAGGVKYASGPRKWSIPLVEPVEFDDVPELPIPAYLLGSLLGDGSFWANAQGSGGVSFCTEIGDANEWVDRLTPMLPAGVSISRRDRGGWAEFYFRGPGAPKRNPLTEVVRGLGLFDVIGCDKSVPEVYLRASIAGRIALLQGLIDTDGHVSAGQPNSVRFTNTSEKLCCQLVELVGSLGGTASITRVQRGSNKPQWTVTVKRLPESVIPCRLARKVARYSPECHVGRYRYLDRVEFVGRKQAQCIRVDYADHLYVTDNYVVTHNTPNIVIQYQQKLAPAQRDQIRDAIAARHAGSRNAFGTLVLDQGADMTVVGDRMQGSAFSDLQSAGEVRLAAAAGVPAIVAGLMQGRQNGAPGEYSDAVRGFVDLTIRPNWRTACSALAKFSTPPPGSQLWFDTADISALQPGQKDAAGTLQVQATTINVLIMSGWQPDAAVKAVTSGDATLLIGQHSGLTSVQMHAPGEKTTPPAPATGDGGEAGSDDAEPEPAKASVAKSTARFDPAEPRGHDGKWTSGPAGEAGKLVRDLKTHPTHSGADKSDANWTSRLVRANHGQVALDSAPAQLTRAPGGHGGDYTGEALSAPAGHGEVRALSEMEGNQYQATNNNLFRKHHQGVASMPSPEKQAIIDHRVSEVDKTMRVSPLPKDTVVYRGVKDGATTFDADTWYGFSSTQDPAEQDAEYERFQDGFRPDLAGLEWTQRGYLHSTVDADRLGAYARPGAGDYPVAMTVLLPGGTQAVRMSEIGHEAELMGQRGLKLRVVTDHGEDANGVRHLDIEVVGVDQS